MPTQNPDSKQNPRPPVPDDETIVAMEEGEKIIESGKARFESADDMLINLELAKAKGQAEDPGTEWKSYDDVWGKISTQEKP